MVDLGVSELALRTAVFVGIAVSMVFYERELLSPGGVVVPGYVALFLLLRPETVLYILVLALSTSLFVKLAARFAILYGRRRFAVTMLIAMSLTFAGEFLSSQFSALHPGFQAVGLIIPGLIANEIHRQGPLSTLSTLAVVSAITVMITILFAGFWQ